MNRKALAAIGAAAALSLTLAACGSGSGDARGRRRHRVRTGRADRRRLEPGPDARVPGPLRRVREGQPGHHHQAGRHPRRRLPREGHHDARRRRHHRRPHHEDPHRLLALRRPRPARGRHRPGHRLPGRQARRHRRLRPGRQVLRGAVPRRTSGSSTTTRRCSTRPASTTPTTSPGTSTPTSRKKLTGTDAAGQKVYGTYHHIWRSVVQAIAAAQTRRRPAQRRLRVPQGPVRPRRSACRRPATRSTTARPNPAGQLPDDVRDAGQAAMMPMGTWYIAGILQAKKDAKPRVDWGIAPMPQRRRRRPRSPRSAPDRVRGQQERQARRRGQEVPRVRRRRGRQGDRRDRRRAALQSDDDHRTRTSRSTGMPTDELSKKAFAPDNVILEMPVSDNTADVDTILNEEHQLIMAGEKSVDDGHRGDGEPRQERGPRPAVRPRGPALVAAPARDGSAKEHHGHHRSATDGAVEPAQRPARTRRARRNTLIGWSFILPNFLGFALLTLVPGDRGVRAGVHGLGLLQPAEWVGPGQLPADVRRRQRSGSRCATPLYYARRPHPADAARLARPGAAAQPQAARACGFFRTAAFFPYVTSMVAVAVVWNMLFNPDSGPINQFLHCARHRRPARLDRPAPTGRCPPSSSPASGGTWATTWSCSWPACRPSRASYYEAAEVDGANAWQRFWHITLPALRPTTFFVLVLLTIAQFKVFDLIVVMTDGGPGRATLVLSQLIYREGIARASSATPRRSRWCCSSSCCVVTVVQFRLSERRER